MPFLLLSLVFRNLDTDTRWLVQGTKVLWRVGEITFLFLILSNEAESCYETSKPTPTMPSSQQAIRNSSSPEEPATHSLVRSVSHDLNVTLRSSIANFLLPFVALGIIAGALEWSDPAVFTLNFLAILPLASLLSYSTDELSACVGKTFGGLLNATFGNAVELIVSYAQVSSPSLLTA